MKHAALRGRASLALVATLALAACKDSKGTASTASAGGKKFDPTCDSAAADYGLELGVAMEAQLKGAAGLKTDVRNAVVSACREDGWDSETLGCLAAAAEYRQRNGKSSSEACVKGLPPDLQAKMDDRIKAAITR